MRLAGFLLVLLLLPGAADAKRKKKKKKKNQDAGPKIGWVKVGEGGGECYYPPDFSALATGPKRMEWQNTRNAMLGQWRGERGDGVSFDPKAIELVENVLLGIPERIEGIAKDNAEQCEKAFSGGGLDAWAKWVKASPTRLTASDCPSPPMDYTMFDYLSVNNDWHIPVDVCKGDKVRILGSPQDMYRLTEDGPYMNVAGDASVEASGLPCTMSECLPGMLIMRFRSREGIDQVLPVGTETEFIAPAHGTITVMINDANLSDNDWRTRRGVRDHASITYEPAE